MKIKSIDSERFNQYECARAIRLLFADFFEK